MHLLSLLLLAGLSLPATPSDDAALIAAQAPLYPLTTCVVSGEDLADPTEIIYHVQDGRLLELCCKGCVKKVGADPAAFIAKLDAAAIAAQKADYPLDVCLVSGEAFGGDMGEPIDVVHAGRYVKLCCGGCTKGLAKNPEQLIAKLDAATMAAQRPHYPLDTCLVSDKPLGDEPVELLHGTKLVQLCCKGCKKKFLAAPADLLAKLDAARSAKPARADADGMGDHGAGMELEVKGASRG
ncbi:MAG: hypothetical protein DRQ55_11530 [Planctomycetota bacterium]|nr:MAG: hypothetical protein DRQ55_11530 [Planctomycetota bacterium]